MQLTGCSKGQGASCILISWSPLDNTHIVHSTLGQYTRPFVNCPDKPKSSQLSAQMWPLLSADLYCSPFDQLISNGRCFPLNSIHTTYTQACAHSTWDITLVHGPKDCYPTCKYTDANICWNLPVVLVTWSLLFRFDQLISIGTVFPLKSHQWTVTPQVSTIKHKEETVCSQCDLFFLSTGLHSPVFLLWNYAWQVVKVVLETWFSSMVTLPASSKLTDATVCSNVAAASRSADLGRPTLQLGIRHLLLSSHSGNTLVSWFRR